MSVQSDTVIIMDDSPTVRFLLKKLFSEMNIEVTGVGQDKKSIDIILSKLKVAGKSPEIFTVDLVMPDINSKELVKRIRDEHPKSKVAVITGFEDQAASAEFERPDSDFFFVKPITKQQLEQISSFTK